MKTKWSLLINFLVILAIAVIGSACITAPSSYKPYVVRVEEKSNNKGISNAEVIVEVTGIGRISSMTGADGYASLSIPIDYVDKPGRLVVEADGYKIYRLEINLDMEALPTLVLLEPDNVISGIPTPVPSPVLPIETATFIPSPTPSLPTGKPIGSVESFSVIANYDPSGYMGDTGDISIAKQSDLVRFTYETNGQGPHEWDWKYKGGELYNEPAQFAGVMLLDPPNNWGIDPDGGYDLRPVNQLIRWKARSLSGDIYAVFLIGGVTWKWNDATKSRENVLYPDSLPRKSLGTYLLTTVWQEFQFDLSNLNPDSFRFVIGGFGWTISWGDNNVQLNDDRSGPEQSRTITIEVSEIQYEK